MTFSAPQLWGLLVSLVFLFFFSPEGTRDRKDGYKMEDSKARFRFNALIHTETSSPFVGPNKTTEYFFPSHTQSIQLLNINCRTK